MPSAFQRLEVCKIMLGENMKDGELKKLIEKRLRNFKPEDRVF
jgi:hypothetical protein